MTSRAGITLLELIVVLAIMGVMAGVVGLAVLHPEVRTQPSTVAAAHAAIAEARREAIESGVSVAITVSIDSTEDGHPVARATPPLHATAFPDGSVVADSALGIDRLTGRPRTRRPRT